MNKITRPFNYLLLLWMLCGCTKLPLTFYGKKFPDYLVGEVSDYQENPARTSDNDLRLQKTWKLESLNGDACPNGKCLNLYRFYLVFEETSFGNNSFWLTGQMPINKFWGNCEFGTSQTIQINNLKITRKNQPIPFQNSEDQFLKILENADYYEITATDLQIFATDDVLIFEPTTEILP